jgi:hypothetical protein
MTVVRDRVSLSAEAASEFFNVLNGIAVSVERLAYSRRYFVNIEPI